MGEEVRLKLVAKLREEIEKSIGRKILTPRDFAYLRDCLYERTHILLSTSTLKRVWGYMKGGEPRDNTLSELARFIGYASFHDFSAASEGVDSSGLVGKRHFRVRDMLNSGDVLTLYWQPGRRCVARYLGNERFCITDSEQTRLLPGDTFRCSLVIEGEPLYLDDLHRDGISATAYVCGKRDGIRYEISRG